MKHNLLFSAFLFVALFFTPNVWANTTVDSFCGFTLSSGSSHPTMTWETNFVGDIIITLNDGSGSTNTVFRSGGMNNGLNDFYIVPADNHNNNTEAKNYFYSEMSGNTFILRRKSRSAADETFLAGKHIKFYDKHVQWACTENNNAAEKVDCYFPYDKSVICGATLDRPVISSIADDGTVSFNAITNATSYVARVYHDLEFLYEQSISPGGKLTYKPYIPESTTYEITIQAFGAEGAKSRESESGSWTTTGNLANLPMSTYCGDFVFQEPDDNNSRARLKIETRKGAAKDTLVFTILKYNESEASAPHWRSNGLNQNGLRYNGSTFTDYFRFPKNGNNQDITPANTQEIRYVPKDNVTVEYGKKITYNLNVNTQNAEWWTALGGDSWTNAWTIDYLYGTNCSAPSEPEPEHSKPTSVSVNDSKVISFTAVPAEEEVESYNAVVKHGETTVKTVTNITSGTTVIDYASTSATTYQVYVQAIKGGDLYSTSEAFDWELSKEINAPSEFCGYDIDDGANPKHHILLTFETNHVGDVIIRLADGDNTTGATFRGNGMGGSWASNNWKVKSNNGATTENASTYFTQEYMEGGTTYILRKKANVTLPADAVITFGNNAVEWRSNNNAVNNAAKTLTMEYTYGSSCATLPLPTITSITEAGVITFPAVIGATSYTARVYDGQTLLYTQENVSCGDVINYTPYYSATFQVTLQALGNNGAYSDESAGTNWALSGDLSNLPASNVCNLRLHQASDDANDVFISIETDDTDGSFYITMQPSAAAFRGNEYIVESGLKYDGNALTDYFERTLLDGSDNKYKTIKYTPKVGKSVQYGKNITFNENKNVQLAWYSNGTQQRNSNQISFTYIYGTKCELSDAFEHSNSVSLYANHPDEDLTVNSAMTINGNNHTIGDITVQTAGALTVGSALTANKLLVETKPGASGQVIGADKLTVSEAWTSQQLLPDEAALMPATDWYCFTVPFEVSLTNGVYTNEGVKMTSGSDYLVWRYDGEQRASTGNGWVKASVNLQPGQAYLIGFKDNETAKTFRFKSAGGALSQQESIALNSYPAAAESNADWNAVGNPSLRHIDVSGIEKVQMLNNATQTFIACETNSYSFGVGAAFFAQQGAGSLGLSAATKTLLAPARTQAQRMQACVEVYKEGRTWPDDRIYVAADEDASDTWQQGHDVPTLNTTSNRVLLMHIAQYGMRLAAVERPWAEQVDYNMVLTAPADGTYTLHMASVTSGASVWLTQNGVPVWDMTAGDYILDMRRGTDTSYGLRLIQTVNPVATGLGNAPDNMLTGTKVLRDGRLVIIKNGTLYNALGQIIQ